MTLSRFLRDYIYIPLGGNKKGEINTYSNLMTTFIVGGLWHGAAWTFVLWGFLHGIALCVHRFWKKLNTSIHSKLALIITFLFVNSTWVFFRAKDFSSAIKVFEGMFGFNGFVIPRTYQTNLRFLDSGLKVDIIILLLAFFIVFFANNSTELAKKFKPSYKIATLMLIGGAYLLLELNKVSEFLYFQF